MLAAPDNGKCSCQGEFGGASAKCGVETISIDACTLSSSSVGISRGKH